HGVGELGGAIGGGAKATGVGALGLAVPSGAGLDREGVGGRVEFGEHGVEGVGLDEADFGVEEEVVGALGMGQDEGAEGIAVGVDGGHEGLAAGEEGNAAGGGETAEG